MLQMWNDHADEALSSGWIARVDESMSIWFQRRARPGWMLVPRKPHPFGNEHHAACCGLSGTLFRLEIVEGKDEPPEFKKKRA